VGDAHEVSLPPTAMRIDVQGRTVLPGLVGMHDHLFYELEPQSGTVSVPAQATFARLYLAAGVTTIRTAGTIDFDGDKRLKQLIDSGSEPGPRIHLTSPYLEGATGAPDPQRTARQVLTYADRGASSVKAYTSLRSSEL